MGTADQVHAAEVLDKLKGSANLPNPGLMFYTAAAILVGFNPDKPVTGAGGTEVELALAVMLAESGGNRLAAGHNANGSTDNGPWQINSGAHPDVTRTCAQNVLCAAKAAYGISGHGQDWRPWCTAWTDGCKGTLYGSSAPYRKYLASARNSVKGFKLGNIGTVGKIATGPVGDAVAGVVDAGAAVGAFLGLLTKGSTWVRVGMFIGGAALVFYGLRGVGKEFDVAPLVKLGGAPGKVLGKVRSGGGG